MNKPDMKIKMDSITFKGVYQKCKYVMCTYFQ